MPARVTVDASHPVLAKIVQAAQKNLTCAVEVRAKVAGQACQATVFLRDGQVYAVHSPQYTPPAEAWARNAMGGELPGGEGEPEQRAYQAPGSPVTAEMIDQIRREWAYGLIAAMVTWARPHVKIRKRQTTEHGKFAASGWQRIIGDVSKAVEDYENGWAIICQGLASQNLPVGSAHQIAPHLGVVIPGEDEFHTAESLDVVAARTGRTRAALVDHVASHIAAGKPVAFHKVSAPEGFLVPEALEDPERAFAPAARPQVTPPTQSIGDLIPVSTDHLRDQVSVGADPEDLAVFPEVFAVPEGATAGSAVLPSLPSPFGDDEPAALGFPPVTSPPLDEPLTAPVWPALSETPVAPLPAFGANLLRELPEGGEPPVLDNPFLPAPAQEGPALDAAPEPFLEGPSEADTDVFAPFDIDALTAENPQAYELPIFSAVSADSIASAASAPSVATPADVPADEPVSPFGGLGGELDSLSVFDTPAAPDAGAQVPVPQAPAFDAGDLDAVTVAAPPAPETVTFTGQVDLPDFSDLDSLAGDPEDFEEDEPYTAADGPVPAPVPAPVAADMPQIHLDDNGLPFFADTPEADRAPEQQAAPAPQGEAFFAPHPDPAPAPVAQVAPTQDEVSALSQWTGPIAHDLDPETRRAIMRRVYAATIEEVAAMKTERDLVEQVARRIESELTTARSNLDQLRARYESVERDRDVKVQAVDSARAEHEAKRSQADALRAEHANALTLVSEQERIIADLLAQLAAAQLRLEEANTAAQQVAASVQRAEADLASTTQPKVTRATSDLDKFDREALTPALAAVEASQAEVERLSAEHTEASGALNTLTERVDRASRVLDAFVAV